MSQTGIIKFKDMKVGQFFLCGLGQTFLAVKITDAQAINIMDGTYMDVSRSPITMSSILLVDVDFINQHSKRVLFTGDYNNDQE